MGKIISIIVAMTPDGVIGKNGVIPWHLPSDLKRFAQITKGHPVIMGRKTYESIIACLGHPLKERTNIVLTKRDNYQTPECIAANSWKQAIQQAKKAQGSNEIFVIGGKEIYKLALPCADKIYLTTVFAEIDGDAYFPSIDFDEWLLVQKEWHDEEGYKSEFAVYVRRAWEEKFINLKHARTASQKKVMKQIEKDGVCPFCMEHLKKYHQNPIIKEGMWWIITKNDTPYKGSFLHLIFIYKPHAALLSEIQSKARDEFFRYVNWAENNYKIAGGTILIRFGNTDWTGASVSHLHAHLIVGGEKKSNAKPLKVKVGYKK